ncbi:MAG TPA: Ig-like domain-containing protein [Polyangia bacterium]
MSDAGTNDPPVAVAPTPTTLDEHGHLDLTLTGTDEESSPANLRFSISTLPSHGELRLVSSGQVLTQYATAPTTAVVRYTPAAHFYGADTFSFAVIDEGSASSPALPVTLTVAEVNSPPAAVDDTATVRRGRATAIDPRANDTDADGDTLTITDVSAPAHGTVVNHGTSLSYTASGNGPFPLTETLTYTVSDGRGATASATLTTRAATPASTPPPTPPCPGGPA